jgi:hypothetical protein
MIVPVLYEDHLDATKKSCPDLTENTVYNAKTNWLMLFILRIVGNV